MQPDGSITELSRSKFRLDVSSSFTSATRSNEVTLRSSGLQSTPGRSPAWLTIDKLNFEALSLYGRDQELEILNKSLDRISSGAVERQLILISGESGIGKTALANSLKTSTGKTNGLFVGGKFDFSNKHEPYSGIVRACAEIFDHIVRVREQNLTLFQKVSHLIKDGLGSELSLLIKFIPDLKEVVDCEDEDRNVLSKGSSACEEAKNRFQFAFQRFIRIISDEFAPLIMVLDDLQWADGSSLDLLDACLSDSEIKKIMIIGTYRSNELDHTHILNNAIDRWNGKCDKLQFEITRISIENLDIDAVNQIIGVLLSMEDDPITMGLAEVSFKKTQGNPFFVLQFLQMLWNSGYLEYNYISFSWHWNNGKIDTGTSATSNVVDVLKAKMAHLPQTFLEILKITSCLGSTFDEECLRIIWENSGSVRSSGVGDSASLTSGLEYLVQNGYVVKHHAQLSLASPQFFSWTHDKIQEAAIMLIPIEEWATFHHDAGDILLSRLGGGKLESVIFVVANLLNEGEALVSTDEKRLVMARLNHDASFRALSISAFESVADYARKGIMLLPNNHWNDHYELSLGLYSIAAQAEGFLGNSDVMEKYCNEVLEQKQRPLKDKLWVYRTIVTCMMGKGQFDEATDLIFNILAMWNCHFPRNFVSVNARVIRTVFKIKSMMKVINPEALPKSENPIMPELMQLSDMLVACLYLKKDLRLPLVIFQILDWTLKHGHTEFSSVAFATAGVILIGSLHDFRRGTWYGEQALKLTEKYQSSAARSRTNLFVHAFIYSWTRPLTQVMKPLLDSCSEGLQSGDHKCAADSILHWLFVRYITGTPLGTLENDILSYSKQMKELKSQLHQDLTNCLHQTVLNLMGRQNKNPAELKGEILSEEDYERLSQDCIMSAALKPWEGILLTYFGGHVQHALTTIRYGHDYVEKSYPAAVFIPGDALLKAVSCYSAARETGKLKYCRMGDKLRWKIKKWLEMGNPNVTHYESFLKAESAAFRKKKDDAVMYYEVTVRHAARIGFLHDAALACERLAEYHLTVLGNREEAAMRMNQSIRHWRHWGALAKVKALEEKYSDLLIVPISLSVKTTTQSENEHD